MLKRKILVVDIRLLADALLWDMIIMPEGPLTLQNRAGRKQAANSARIQMHVRCRGICAQHYGSGFKAQAAQLSSIVSCVYVRA
jgi:hypothetical protein